MKKLKNIKQWDTVATAKVSHHRKTIFTFICEKTARKQQEICENSVRKLRENISLYF